MKSHTQRLSGILLFSCIFWLPPVYAGLEGCESLFFGYSLTRAPTLYSSPSDAPFGTNKHLCYQAGGTAFFATEYWPERHSPRWTAYRIDKARFGGNGCRTYTRATGNCYINAETWAEPFTCEGSDRSDPFHRDHALEDGLTPQSFTNTGHDRGHIAPRQSLSWHVCGAYQTFTMANMSPQSAAFNQGVWADIEEQVLSWGLEHGPLYVVSGTTYRPFPHQAFAVYQDGALDADQIYPSGFTLEAAAERIQSNYAQYPSGHPLRPKRDANPVRMQDSVRDLVVPTGYFKVIMKPPIGTQPAKAIGFLLPHSSEDLKSLVNHYEGFDSDMAYWAFSARIDLIEQTAAIRFPAIMDESKSQWRDQWFFDHRGSSEIRGSQCGLGEPLGVLLNASKHERIAACTPLLYH